MARRKWTVEDIPDQTGKLVVVTGANSGLGYQTARALAGKGTRVVLAVRDEQKGRAAAEAIGQAYPRAEVEVMVLDLADLRSVRGFADTFRARYDALPLLINNAGVMALPYRRTADGFEMQFGTNHLGHFALTGLLLPAILAAPGARVVTVSSGAHANGSIDLDNLDGSRGYSPWRAYAQSKLANLLFAYALQRRFALTGLLLPAILAAPSARVVTVSSGAHANGSIDFENLDGSRGYRPWRAYAQSKLANLLFAYALQRRFAAAGATALSVGCHPGWAATNLQEAGPRMAGARLRARLMTVATRVLAQSAAMGALPVLYAATADGVNGCDYIGPTSWGGMRGYPGKVRSSPRSYDAALARRLWQVSEDLTGVHYEALAVLPGQGASGGAR